MSNTANYISAKPFMKFPRLTDPTNLLCMWIQVGGWSQVYKNLTFVTVREAGHEVPEYQPGRAFALFKYFLRGHSMPTFNYSTSSS